MVPRPCRADGAGSQAAPSAALGPAPLAAQEAAAQDQPDLSACPWSWLWPQAGLGEFAWMSWPGCGPWSRCLGSQFGLHWLWPLLAQAWPCWVTGPCPDLLPEEVRRHSLQGNTGRLEGGQRVPRTTRAWRDISSMLV